MPFPLKVVFMGTSEFAVPCLEALLNANYEVAAVVTQPDKLQGRGRSLHASPIKRFSIERGLQLFQPKRVRSQAVQQQLAELQPDLLIVAAFGQIIPQSLLDLPKIAPINVHGSLLPKYRGAAPIQHSIINGETETGVTTMWMDATLDTGDMLLSKSTPITSVDDVASLTQRLSSIGAELLLETIDGLIAGTVVRTPQDNALATQAPAIQPTDGYLNWTDSASQLNCRIRGVSPKPGAVAQINGKNIKVWVTQPENSDGNSTEGTVLDIAKGAGGVLVQCGIGTSLRLIEVQPESGKRMNASDWARGIRLTPGEKFMPMMTESVSKSKS